MTGLVAAAVLIPAVLFGGTASSHAPVDGPAVACASATAIAAPGVKDPGTAAHGEAYGTVPVAAGGCLFAGAPTSLATPACRVATAFGAAAGAQGRCVPARPK